MCAQLDELKRNKEDLKKRIKSIDDTLNKLKNRAAFRKQVVPLLGRWFLKSNAGQSSFVLVDVVTDINTKILKITPGTNNKPQIFSEYTSMEFYGVIEFCTPERELPTKLVELNLGLYIQKQLELVMSKVGQ